MLKWFKSLFFKNNIALNVKELEDKVCAIEKEVTEITNVLQNQAALLAVIAGVQCDLVSFLSGSTNTIKPAHKDSTDPLVMLMPDDDEFIN